MIHIIRNAEGYPSNYYLVGNHLEVGDIEVPARPDSHHIWNGTAWELSADGLATKYQRDRKAEYDQLNQFEMQFDDDRDGTTTWVDTINEIKGRYPK